jgi:hypothetical protein
MTSHNPTDVRDGYCGNCHDWTRDATEFAFHCTVCDHRESWTSDAAAKCAGVWHVFGMHPELWYGVLVASGQAFRPPVDPRPETLGWQFEEWESQL